MVCTHSMVRTSNTSTPYSLYTVTWEGLQPSADERGGVSGRGPPRPPPPPTGSGRAPTPATFGERRGAPAALSGRLGLGAFPVPL